MLQSISTLKFVQKSMKEVELMAQKKSTHDARRHELMRLLKARSRVTYDELYELGLYGLDTKTFERDRAYLHEHFGVEIGCENKAYYLKNEGRFLFSLEFSEQEAEALALGLQIVAHFLPHMDSSSLKAWRKLRAYMPGTAGENAEAIRQFTQIFDSVEIDAKVFETLVEALRLKKNLNIVYKEKGKRQRRLTVTPKNLNFEDGSCYLEADSSTTGTALYALSAIKSATLELDE